MFTESGYKVHLMPPSRSLNHITRLHSFKTTNELSPMGLPLSSSTVVSETEGLSATLYAESGIPFRTPDLSKTTFGLELVPNVTNPLHESRKRVYCSASSEFTSGSLTGYYHFK